MFTKEELKKAKGTSVKLVDVSFVDGAFEKELREELHLTQSLMAAMLHVSSKTVEAWEQGTNELSDTAKVLLFLIADDRKLARRLMQIEAIGKKIPDKLKFFELCRDANSKHVDYKDIDGTFDWEMPSLSCDIYWLSFSNSPFRSGFKAREE
ncbi:MAG: hypothetical protein J6328_00460 [Bacilli bacterium]|nr:hypothetical protein [Bacilli bacterium]